MNLQIDTRSDDLFVGWHRRGYKVIPDESPPELEANSWAPSWRRMCKVLLRNDYWCKGLGFTQPKSDAYKRYKEIKAERKLEQAGTVIELFEGVS